MSARIPVTSHDKSMNMITKLASIQIRSQKRVGCLIRAGIGKWRAAGLVVHASTAQSTAHRAKAHAVATGNTQLRQCTAQRPADGFAAKNKKSQTQLGRVRQFQSRQQSGEHNKKSQRSDRTIQLVSKALQVFQLFIFFLCPTSTKGIDSVIRAQEKGSAAGGVFIIWKYWNDR